MTKPVKAITLSLWILCVAAMVGFVAELQWTRQRAAQAHQLAVSSDPFSDASEPTVSPDSAKDLPSLGVTAPTFSLVDQLNRPRTTASLAGHPWIADFIFTTCASECPLITQRMTTLQAALPPQIKLISFTVDPRHDDPHTLEAYAQQYHADSSRWFFLTGDPQAVMAAVDGMKVAVLPADQANPIRHDTHFLLMDGQGHMRGIYDSKQQADVMQLIADAKTLLASAPSAKAPPSAASAGGPLQ